MSNCNEVFMNINFTNVSFRYVERMILNQASFSFETKEKIGVIGVNGVGKTTLIKLILGLEVPLTGVINITGGLRINYLPQDPHFDEDKTLFEIMMEGSTKEVPILAFVANSMLTKMNLNPNDTVKNFSGGELKRLALAKALVTPCDLLILDEPTNHLDNELIVWLEKYLMKMKNGLFMVTHDRYFLQRVCNKMLELEDGKVYLYEANYEKFLELKAIRIAESEHQKAKLKSFLRVEREWINRGAEARRTKAKYRVERFNELAKTKLTNDNKKLEISSVKTYLGKKLISMKNGTKAFGDRLLFSDFSFDLNRTDIIGVVGPNGAGKSTLFKILKGEEMLTSGTLEIGETLKIGYFAQNLTLIDPEIRVIDYIKDEANQIETLDGIISASSLLERFLFTPELQYTKVKMLSGGERRRLMLVRVLMTNPNMLLFDEPTNDLDLFTLEILEDYLLKFKGPILVVSHDRYFLDKICNKLFIFKNGHITQSLLSFSEYLKEANDTVETLTKTGSSLRVSNKLPAKIRNEYNSLDEEIPLLEQKIKTLKDEMAQITTDYTKLMEYQTKIDDLNEILDAKTTRYLELLEIKEQYER